MCQADGKGIHPASDFPRIRRGWHHRSLKSECSAAPVVSGKMCSGAMHAVPSLCNPWSSFWPARPSILVVAIIAIEAEGV